MRKRVLYTIGLGSLLGLSVAGLRWISSSASTGASKDDIFAPSPKVLSALEGVRGLVTEASRRDDLALKHFREAIQGRLTEHAPLSRAASRQMAEHSSTLSSCVHLVYLVSADLIRSRDDAGGYLRQKANPILLPVVNSFIHDMRAEFRYFVGQLQLNSVRLADEVENHLKLNPAGVNAPDKSASRRAAQAFANEVLLIAVTSNLNVDVRTYERLTEVVSQKGNGLVRTVFARQVKRIPPAVAVAAADGPLLFGDAITAFMLAYTLYDLHEASKQFELELIEVLERSLLEANQSVADAFMATAVEVTAGRARRRSVAF